MKKIFLSGALLYLAMVSSNIFAGSNPVGWSLNPSTGFPSTTSVGSTYTVAYTLTNNTPFSLPTTVSMSNVGGTFTMSNGCNTTLASKASCIVHVSFQPIKVGAHSARVSVKYGNNVVPLPLLSSTATSPDSNDKITGHVTTPLPASTYTGSNYPVEFTFANNGTATVTATSVTVTGFTASTNTCTAALTPNSSCVVSGTFSPSVVGQTTLGVTYTYYNGGSISVPLSTQTNVISGGGSCHQVDGTTALPLPVTTYQYADNVVKFVFTNHCNSNTETLGNVSITSDGSTTITKGTDNCSGVTLAANGSCSVLASIVPNATASNLAVTATVPYFNDSLVATAATSETVNAIPNPTTSHTVMFVNQCDENVWYEFQNGAGGTGPTRKSPDPTPVGQRTFADYQINKQLVGAAPATKILTVDEYVNGAIYGRTGCDSSTGNCLTANCPVIANTATCQVSVGANNPATIFETNMNGAAANDGVYDVSIINGFNIPGQVKSLAPIGSDPFGCGQSTGAIIQPVGSSLGACPWTFTPPSTGIDSTANYYWVSGGADDGCTAATSCGTGKVCGTAYASSTEGTAPINRRCGTFLGYWTLASYVGYTATNQWGSVDLYTTYSMGTALPNGPNGSYGNVGGSPATYAAIYSCAITSNNSLNTGYGNTMNVCGCYDWNQTGSVVPTAQSTNCTGNNSDWENTVFPRISWLKQACPTAYSYQFDDKSSSFTCNISGQKTSYQITFCPGGKNGKPS